MAPRSGSLLAPASWRPAWWTRVVPAHVVETEVLTLAEWSVRAVDVRPRRPVEIACLAGELLVTFEGNLEDHIIPAGEAFRADRRGRLVLAAIRPSRVRIRGMRRGAAVREAPGEQPSVPGRR